VIERPLFWCFLVGNVWQSIVADHFSIVVY